MRYSTQVIILICDNPGCGNRGLYQRLQAEVSTRGLPVHIEETGCLGACDLQSRVDVKTPDGRFLRYAATDSKRAEWTYFAIGENPIKTLIEANLPRPTG